MNGPFSDHLSKLIDSKRFERASAIPEAHFYGLTTQYNNSYPVIRARFSPTGDRPYMIKIDGKEQTFYCSCDEFQKKAGYPARMGLLLCDHILRTLTLLDQKTLDDFGFEEQWKCHKGDHEYQRQEVIAQTSYFFNMGDTLSALSEIFFGIQASILRDMDVNNILQQLDVDSVQDQDLPEAMRFVRVALQRGFARKARELAGAWIERFAENIDSFEPFDDVAPVALWLKRWGASPDVHQIKIRELVLKSLEKAKDNKGRGASWWLLYRAISRAGAAPPDSCVAAWKNAIADMKLSLVHPDRIKDAVKLLDGFSIFVPGPDYEFARMHSQSLARAREWRMNFLLRLAKAHHLEPFLQVEINPYLSGRFITVTTKSRGDPLQEMILSAMGYKGSYLPIKRFAQNWPIIKRCAIKPPALEGEIRTTVMDLWPNSSLDPPPMIPLKKHGTHLCVKDKKSMVVRWDLSSPGLIANSPLVAHHGGRIYVPARGGADWPDVLGLTLCKYPTSMGRRLFTLEVVKKINSEDAIKLVQSGAEFIGSKDDPVRLLSMPLENLPLDVLLAVPKSLNDLEKKLSRQTWFPDRLFSLEKIKSKMEKVRAWGIKGLWEELSKGIIPKTGVDIGFIFGKGISIFPDEKTMAKIADLAEKSDSQKGWIEGLGPILARVLPSLDSVKNPVPVMLLEGTPLAVAAPAIVRKRKEKLSAINFEAVKGFYDLEPLKKTIYGAMILDNLDLSDRKRIRRSEAAELIKALSSLGMGVESLPLFTPKKD